MGSIERLTLFHFQGFTPETGLFFDANQHIGVMEKIFSPGPFIRFIHRAVLVAAFDWIMGLGYGWFLRKNGGL